MAPWCGKFFRLSRIKDWLALLDFETTHGTMLYYRPPLRNEGFMHRLHFLDKMGDRWWPMMAGAYLVVAKKRVLGVTPTTRFFATTRYTPAIIGHQRSPILSRKCNRCIKPSLRSGGR